MAQDPLELALRAFLNPGFIDGVVNFLEAFDDYEDRKTEKHADKQLLQNALVLYKQGRINRDQFLEICETLCPEKPIQASQDPEVNNLFKKKLNQANGRLKATKLGVRIEPRGNKLSLVATFPPKPKADHHQWKQQRLALGIYANGAGLQQAEKEARKVGALLATREFRWQDYLQSKSPTACLLLIQILGREREP